MPPSTRTRPRGQIRVNEELPSLDTHYGEDRVGTDTCLQQACSKSGVSLKLVRHPSAFTDCLSSLIEQRVYHKKDAILTSIP
jgi:hypothetical protein